MPEPGQIERSPSPETKLPTLASELLPNPNRRQKQILAQLGSLKQISERLYGHIRNVYREGDLSPDSSSETEEKKFLVGELVELLVAAEVGLFPIFHNNLEIVNLPKTENSQTNGLLLGVLHNPDVIRLGTQVGRNPDLVIIDTDSGVVRAVGEVKLGILNRRALKQLESSGFEKISEVSFPFLIRIQIRVKKSLVSMRRARLSRVVSRTTSSKWFLFPLM